MTVDDLINDVILKEGTEYTLNSNDRGGPTKYGITQRTLELALHHKVTSEDVKGLTEENARVIYKNLYFYGPRIDQLPEALQPCTLDMAVNSGPRAAGKCLQTTLNMAGFPCSEDGLIGPATIVSAQEGYKQMGPFLINALCDYRIWFYRQIVANDPSQVKWIHGWENRANSFRVEV